MTAHEEYVAARDAQVKSNMKDLVLDTSSYKMMEEMVRTNYVKNFTWMGIPILQYPSDLMVMQELVWSIRPDVIIETGIAFGGMLVFYAGLLEAMKDGPFRKRRDGIVIGIDNEIRKHNSLAIRNHPLRSRIALLEKDSRDPDLHEWLKSDLREKKTLISLDSNHTHAHVLAELRLYAPLVSLGSYIVVFDTHIETYHHLMPQDRPWNEEDNPATAVRAFLEENDEFIVDRDIEQRALLTAAPGGWLKRIK
jgi:cephalosporin hydroxylase